MLCNISWSIAIQQYTFNILFVGAVIKLICEVMQISNGFASLDVSAATMNTNGPITLMAKVARLA